MKSCKKLWNQYRHALLLILYVIIYWIWFWHLEATITDPKYIIHMRIDDYIPFWEVFVIPYCMWFGYITAVILYLLFADKREYYRACLFLFTGMTIFLIISTLWPNGHQLRLDVMPRDNLFTHIVASLWRTDTPNNLWPSIHVYNSLGAHFAVLHCKKLNSRKWIRRSSFILCWSIILSTVFIKQHSMFDVITAFGMAAIFYWGVYCIHPSQSLLRLKSLFSEPHLQ